MWLVWCTPAKNEPARLFLERLYILANCYLCLFLQLPNSHPDTATDSQSQALTIIDSQSLMSTIIDRQSLVPAKDGAYANYSVRYAKYFVPDFRSTVLAGSMHSTCFGATPEIIKLACPLGV